MSFGKKRCATRSNATMQQLRPCLTLAEPNSCVLCVNALANGEDLGERREVGPSCPLARSPGGSPASMHASDARSNARSSAPTPGSLPTSSPCVRAAWYWTGKACASLGNLVDREAAEASTQRRSTGHTDKDWTNTGGGTAQPSVIVCFAAASFESFNSL